MKRNECTTKAGTRPAEKVDILSDNMLLEGSGYSSAAKAFQLIENSSYSIGADMSLVSVLTVIGRKDGIRQAILLDGNDELEIRDGNVCLKDAMYVNIKGSIREEAEEVSLFFCLGGCYKTPLNIDDPDMILVGTTSLKSLCKQLKIEHRGKGYFRDAGIAAKCESFTDEKRVFLFCREQDGVKKMFCCYTVQSAARLLTFEQVVDMVRRSTKGASISYWKITQEKKVVRFRLSDRREFEVTWSDTGLYGINLQAGKTTYPAKSAEELENHIRNAVANFAVWDTPAFVFFHKVAAEDGVLPGMPEIRCADHVDKIDWQSTVSRRAALPNLKYVFGNKKSWFVPNVEGGRKCASL